MLRSIFLKNFITKHFQIPKNDISKANYQLENEKIKQRDSKKGKTLESKENEEVFNEIPIKLANEHLKVEDELDKRKLKENMFILVPPRTSVIKSKKPKNIIKS